MEAFRATIGFIAAQPSGSGVVFDYSQPRATLAPNEQLERDSLSARVQSANEPFHLFFTPKEIAAELNPFCEIEDLSSPEINARYFAARTDALKLYGSAGRFISAWR